MFNKEIKMEFSVRDWMLDLVVFIDPDATVTEALATMRRRYINSVMVRKTKAHPEYGILTSTDVSDKIVAQGQNPSKIKVADIMTSPTITVDEYTPIAECAKIMHEKKIHHLPVTNKAKEVIGMISATDFLVVAEAMGRAPGEPLR
jgi:CBS domain-containing protein